MIQEGKTLPIAPRCLNFFLGGALDVFFLCKWLVPKTSRLVMVGIFLQCVGTITQK